MTVFSQGGPHTERTSKFAVIGALNLSTEPDASMRKRQTDRQRGGGGGGGGVGGDMKRKGKSLDHQLPRGLLPGRASFEHTSRRGLGPTQGAGLLRERQTDRQRWGGARRGRGGGMGRERRESSLGRHRDRQTDICLLVA